MVKVIEPVRAPEHEEEFAGSRRRNWWKAAHYLLAAASALPLLWWGGLHSWPWTDKTPVASAITPVDPTDKTPTHLEMARLHIDTAVEPLSTDPSTGALDTPDYGQAGWYAAGPNPGTVGRAVILGHRLDAAGADDVFADLADAKAGDQIVLDTQGGTKVTFVVKSVKTYALTDVPADEVYGPSKTAQLRLVAPTGDNKDVIVFADLSQ
jgi:hypothetical protein